MGLIPQTKCSRCDRTYSGLRSRCPYCGAHRGRRGKRVSDGNNATWKLIIGILLIVVLITAVVVILVTGANEKTPPDGNPSGSGTPSIDHEQGKNPTGDPTDNSDDNTPRISVTNPDGTPVTSLTLKVGGTADLTAVVTPDTVTAAPTWTSSDPAIVTVAPSSDTSDVYKVTGVAKGTVTVTVTVEDAKYEFTVTVEEDTSSPTATAVVVRTQYGSVLDDLTLRLGEQLELTVELTPSTCKSTPQWTNDHEEACQLVLLDETGMRVRITGMGDFGPPAVITCTVDGIEFKITVHTNNVPFNG